MSVKTGYSEEALIADLKTWWDKQVSTDDDPFADPPRSRIGTIFEVVPVLDSLGVVSALVTIEKHLDFQIPPQVIKPGGYSCFDEMISDLLPKIRTLIGKLRKRKEAA